MSNAITVYALDGDFNLVTMAIPYDNLQWNRKYYEAGSFEMQIPISVYDISWKYIGTSDRPELGMVQKVYGNDNDRVLVRGFFCEKMLDFRVCFPRYVGDSPKTETAVRSILSRYGNGLPITLGAQNVPPLGDRTQSDFVDDRLGTKIYAILETRECSYRVRYDFVGNELVFEVWQGKDRTQSQSANPYQTFSAEFGNITSRSIDFDDSDYRNYAIVPINGDDEVDFREAYDIDLVQDGEMKREVVIDMRSRKPEEGYDQSEFLDSVMQEAAEKLMAYKKVESIDVGVTDKGYMVDYDIGDKCDVILTDIGVTMETRIVEVNEVFKGSEHSVSVGLGNKRITNMRRAVNSL